MEVFLYRNGSDKVEEGFSRDDLPALLADETNVVWVDLQGETPEHVEEAKDVLLSVFGFHHLTVEDCIEVRHQPKVEAFEKYIYLVVHGIKPGETGPSNFVTKELDAYLGANFVVTFHVQRFRSLKTVKQHLRTSTYICQRGAAYLLHSILDELIDLYTPIVEDFDNAIESLEDRVFDMRRSNNAVLADIMDVRRAVARLRRISARQLEVLHRIARGEFPQIPANVLPFYRDVHDHLVRITDLAEGYRDLVASLFDMHFSVIATKTNDVMKTLAVVSAIILPLSLIAGIYGMNFENMPELKTPYGYFLTLLLMLVVTLLLLVYFWYKGWIFQSDAQIVIESTRPDQGDFEEK